MILVDSSKYISWMRAGRNPVRLLAAHVQSGELISSGIVRIEVLRGVLKPKVKEQLSEFFQLLPEVALTPALLQETAELAWTLDRRRIILPVADLLIGVSAKKAGAAVVTDDPHFRRIPALKVLAELPPL